MSEVKFMAGGYLGGKKGFAPVTPNNQMSDGVHHCKEVFAHRFISWNGRVPTTKGKDGVIKFLYRDDAINFTKDFVKQKMATLHVFEKAMDFEPLAKCEVIWNEQKVFLFYTVSESWAKSHPVIHILALLVRNHYPEGEIMEWPEIISWLKAKRRAPRIAEAITEIIANKGKIRENINQGNGISDYAYYRAQSLKPAGRIPLGR